MIMSKNEFAVKLFDFLKENEPSGNFAKAPKEDCIEELESYLSDLHMVKETIKDIDEIADMLDDHEYYVAEVKPLLYCLRDIQGELETEQSRRMVGDTKYEVIHAIHIGDKEIVFAEDKNAENGMNWFVGGYTSNAIVGEYDGQICDDYIEAMQDFTGRVNKQIEAMKSEISQSKPDTPIFTAEHCHRNDYSQSIDGKIVAVKADIFRPEYRRGEVQIVLVNGGNGAKANPHGNAVFCYHLNDGKHTRFERYDIQGEVKQEFIPKWAKEKAAEIQAEKANPPQKKPKDREER